MSNLSELLPSGGGQNVGSFEASGTIANGKAVGLRSDGKVEAIATTTDPVQGPSTSCGKQAQGSITVVASPTYIGNIQVLLFLSRCTKLLLRNRCTWYDVSGGHSYLGCAINLLFFLNLLLL